MTRDEFIVQSMKDIDAATRSYKKNLMDIVENAWAEGKRNAEIDGVLEVVRTVLSTLKKEGRLDDECTGQPS